MKYELHNISSEQSQPLSHLLGPLLFKYGFSENGWHFEPYLYRNQ